MNDHGLEQLVNFPTRERNIFDLILTSLPGQFVDIHSPDKLSDHDIVSGTLKIAIPSIKKPRRKVYRYQKGDYESMRAETCKGKILQRLLRYSVGPGKFQSHYIVYSRIGR